jgi:hypothetical protein
VEAVYRVTAPIAEIGALPGDYVRIAPSDPEYPLTLCRHLEEGAISPGDPRLRACASGAAAAAGSSSPGPRSRHPHLRVVG